MNVLVRNPNPDAAAYRGLALAMSAWKSSPVELIQQSHMTHKMAAPALSKILGKLCFDRSGASCFDLGGNHCGGHSENVAGEAGHREAPKTRASTGEGGLGSSPRKF